MESKDDENAPPHRSVCIVSILAILVIISTLLIFPQSKNISVSYDNRAITINGQRRILISGAIHYPRSTPQMWPDLIQKAKDGGLDVIETYVFWDGHEPAPGEYYFEERYDLVQFVKIVRDAGLYVNIRLGPYICAEWNFGGFPVWLKYVPGISFRTDNEPFKAEMAKFVKKIVDMMKNEQLFAWQGGPIILAQIENELGPVEEYAGPGSKEYAAWSAELALDLDVRIPWIMCKQVDAPDPIIDTCNGFYCDGFTPNKPYKPKLWTEAWTGWFTSFGDPVPHRPIEDLAYSVVSFIKNGGSLVSYYMYHGGTNFGRTAGNFIATSYDYDAPIDEFGLIREQKWGHLRDLHKIIKLCEPTLLHGDLTINNHGRNQESYVYRLKSGTCVAFLANNDAKSQATIEFNGTKYTLPPWSASILPDCKNEAYNSARVVQKPTKMKMEEVQKFSWMSFNEQTEVNSKSTFATNGLLENVNVTRNTVNDNTIKTFTTTGLLEQLNLTRDTTDYLWYTTYVNTSKDELFLKNGLDLVISVSSAGPLLHLYVNGELKGIAYGSLHRSVLTYSGNVKLLAGINKISILSVTVGLYNGGTHYENWNYGVLGPVILYGHNGEKLDLSMQSWTYQIGLKGEALALHSPSGISSVDWGEASRSHPLTWYKAYFDTPEGKDPLALDMSSMGKGIAWVNGHNIGRYWPGFIAKGSCTSCDYRGHHNESVCVTDCGSSSQRWYHMPRSWLNKKQNLLVVFEEWGGDTSGISLVKRLVHK